MDKLKKEGSSRKEIRECVKSAIQEYVDTCNKKGERSQDIHRDGIRVQSSDFMYWYISGSQMSVRGRCFLYRAGRTSGGQPTDRKPEGDGNRPKAL